MSQELETAPHCYRHPDRETYVCCVRCERPICPDCMVEASVGFQCPECVREGNKSVREARTVFGGRHTGGAAAVTKVLIGINLAGFVYELTVGDVTAVVKYGMQPLAIAVDGQFYRLITSAFLHYGVLHLALNMFALYSLGQSVEQALGRGRFVALYVTSALGGSAASYVLSGPLVLGAGASGAVYGLFGAYFVIARRLRLDTSQILGLIGVNLVISFAIPRIDWRAHIGGLITGAAITAVFAYVGARRDRDRIHAVAVATIVLLLLATVAVRTDQLRSDLNLSSPATRSSAMRDAVIVEAVRTPVGKRNGALKDVHPVDLSAHVLAALVHRAGVDPALVEDVIWGCVSQIGEQALNVGRCAALAAGWPEDVVGVTLDRQCGSSQQAVHFAAAGVIAGHYDVVVAGGVESMTRVPMLSTITQGPGIPFGPLLMARYDNGLVPQGISAEIVATRWGLSRRDVDEFALASHERAAAAIDEGAFTGQIAPVLTGDTEFAVDEGVRRGGTLDSLATLKPAFQDDGVVTAANSSQISDGAAALLVTTSERAAQLGLRPLVRFHTGTLAGVDPITMLTAPIPATRKLLERSGVRLDEIGTFEVNEAFACVPLAWEREYTVDRKVLNPLGGAIALGHPLGGSGARIMTTLVHHMVDNGLRYGLQTMCEGGGMANATLLELVA